jgi:prevent-host-death family protein
MATKVNIHQAKTSFSQLVEKALRGEEVIIAKHGKPLLRLVPVEGSKRPVELHPHRSSKAEIAAVLAPLDESELAEWYK